MAEIYQIQVQGMIDNRWASWFEGMTIAADEKVSVTTLTGTVADQAALMGVLNHLYMLGLPLLFVEWSHSDRPISARATADVEGNSF